MKTRSIRLVTIMVEGAAHDLVVAADAPVGALNRTLRTQLDVDDSGQRTLHTAQGRRLLFTATLASEGVHDGQRLYLAQPTQRPGTP